MNDETESVEKDDAGSNGGQAGGRARTHKLTKVLPTERVSFEKQMNVLRAYAAASGQEKKAVTNDEVAAVLSGLAASSISLCNPFFSDCGLLIAEGRKQKPSDAVFDYLHAYEWNPESAATKLRPALIDSWAAKELLPKLAFRTLGKDEAIKFLAEASKAQKAHRRNLETLLEFLNAAGVLLIEGNSVSKLQASQPGGDEGKSAPPADQGGKVDQKPEKSEYVEQFTIPIPGKEPAIIMVPKNLDADDWEMLSVMIATYIKRLRNEKFHALGGSK